LGKWKTSELPTSEVLSIAINKVEEGEVGRREKVSRFRE